MRKHNHPGKAARVLAAVLTLLMMLTLTLGCFVWQTERVLTDRALHESIALDSRVVDAQMQRINARVNEIAQAHPFRVETVTNVVTRQSVEEFNRDVVSWWLGLMQADPVMETPAYDAGDVEAAVREDAVFQENTPSTRRRAVARDDIAYEVGRAVDRAVLPVRADVLGILLPKVLEMVNVPSLMNILAMAPQLCGVAALILALLVLLVLVRRPSCAGLYVGAGLAGSALCVAGFGLMAYLLDVTGMVAEISPLLAMQVSLLTKQVALQAGIYAAAALAAGMVLIALYQHARKHQGQSWRVMNA